MTTAFDATSEVGSARWPNHWSTATVAASSGREVDVRSEVAGPEPQHVGLERLATRWGDYELAARKGSS
jgi:hypothetical protein